MVELCQAGNQQAFGDLYARYYLRLLRFCTRRVGSVHEAEEITQESFARAFAAMPRLTGERRFYPWLTVIASRLCIDSHRRVSRTEPSAELDLGGVEGGQQQIVDNVDIAYLGQAIAQLGPRHREVLELRETRGWSYQQIADHYEVTLGTVEALLFRARKALRREFVAIAGEDSRWAGVPIAGLLWRAANSARARLHDLQSQALPYAALGVASVAAVAGGVALAPSHSSSPPPVLHRAHALPSSKSGVVTGGLKGRADSSSPADAKKELRPKAPGTRSPLSVTGGSAADGRARTENDPSTLTVGSLSVSTDFANPDALIEGLHP